MPKRLLIVNQQQHFILSEKKMTIKPILLLVTLSSSIFGNDENTTKIWNKNDIQKLREHYSQPIKSWRKPILDEGIKYIEMKSISQKNDKPNPLIIKLGNRLFHEPRLSLSENVACISCHVPSKAFTDGLKHSEGHNRLTGTRNAPTVIGLSNGELFWDGRAKNYEEQALGPIANPVEMAMPIDTLEKKLPTMEGYASDVQKIYGDSNLTVQRVSEALATFQKSLTHPRTRFDDFLDGNTTALNNREIFGLDIFRNKGRCMNCHNGENFSDGQFHNLGMTYFGRDFEDLGRYLVTKKNEDVGKFKTPTLRQISKTAPYMHNGFFKNLKSVINMYNNGMFHPNPNEKQKNDPKFPVTSKHLQKLNLTKDEQNALEAFLKIL